MIPPLPRAFLELPIAHRALHDAARGRPENSRAAVRAAMAAGHGIEIDLQISSDGHALVFHDPGLLRMTGQDRPVNQLTAAEAGAVPLRDGDGEGIPTLVEVLAIIAGAVPLLIEIKDQDGRLGPRIGRLEAAVAAALSGYAGPVAVMSFNPNSVAHMRQVAPGLPRGLVTSGFDDDEWDLGESERAHLRGIRDFDRVGAGFISHDSDDLDNPRVAELRAAGVPVLCWTVRSEAAARAARRYADNITYEGFGATLPA